MNTTLSIRLANDLLNTLKEIAAKEGTSVSQLYSDAIKKVVSGRISLHGKDREVKKVTTLSLDYETAVAFKERLKEINVPFDQAIPQLASYIVQHRAEH